MNLKSRLEGSKISSNPSTGTKRQYTKASFTKYFFKVDLKFSKLFLTFLPSSLLVTLKKTLHCHFQRSRFLSTHFSLMYHFYIPWKRQKTKGFLTFSRGIEMEHWGNMGDWLSLKRQGAIKTRQGSTEKK